MRVRLTRKFANFLNGIDLTDVSVGDVVEMKAHEAALVVAEGWAVVVPATSTPPAHTDEPSHPSETGA